MQRVGVARDESGSCPCREWELPVHRVGVACAESGSFLCREWDLVMQVCEKSPSHEKNNAK